jgi:hypothetical protein
MPIDIAEWRGLAQRRKWRDFLDFFFIVSVLWSQRTHLVRGRHMKMSNIANRMFIV